MALEETVLDGENMTNLLKANWDISCASSDRNCQLFYC